METKYVHPRTTIIFPIIAGIGVLFSCIFIIRAANEGRLYNALYSDADVDASSPLGHKIAQIENTFRAHEAMQDQEYETALQLISGNSSEEYYNRGTLQTLLAYKNALQSSVSWMENAQVLIAQAKQSFSIAKKLSVSGKVKEAITDNQLTVDSLSSVIDIKTCYGIGQAIISSMESINEIIAGIKGTIGEEEQLLQKKASALPAECSEKLRDVIDSSKEQVGALELQMMKDTRTYGNDFETKIDDPLICLQAPYENILPSMLKWAKGLADYQQTHQSTVEALQSQDKQLISELCNPTKNDSQINQQIEDSVQEMLEKIEQNKYENQQQQQRASNEVKYKDLFNEDEKDILQQIQTINQWRIHNTLDTRGQSKYSPQEYIDDMFNQFYGNSGDFIDLHK